MRRAVLLFGLLFAWVAPACAADLSQLLGHWYIKAEKDGRTIGFMKFDFLDNGRFVQEWVKGANPYAPADADGNIDYYGRYEFDGTTLKFAPAEWKAWTFRSSYPNNAMPAAGYIGSMNSSAVQFIGSDQMRFQDQVWTRGSP